MHGGKQNRRGSWAVWSKRSLGGGAKIKSILKDKAGMARSKSEKKPTQNKTSNTKHLGCVCNPHPHSCFNARPSSLAQFLFCRPVVPLRHSSEMSVCFATLPSVSVFWTLCCSPNHLIIWENFANKISICEPSCHQSHFNLMPCKGQPSWETFWAASDKS